MYFFIFRHCAIDNYFREIIAYCLSDAAIGESVPGFRAYSSTHVETTPGLSKDYFVLEPKLQ
jgi:hypothetical protein